jgi:hypothetical protein
MGLDDLDVVLALVERGEALPDILRRVVESESRELGPLNWVAANYKIAAADMRPRFVTVQHEKAMDRVTRRLFPSSSRSGDADSE